MSDNPHKINIREFRDSDAPSLFEILEMNNQYEYPEIEGSEAMKRVSDCAAAIFRVAEVDGHLCGQIKAVFDGSRAIIHLISVHPDYQHRGVGQRLLNSVYDELDRRGAPTVSVTVTDKSADFWEKEGFKRLPVFLMLKEL